MPTALNLATLVDHLLQEQWRRDCEIIPGYMPPYPRADTKPRVVVRYKTSFLRYSHGPHQGFFWDIYGDDFHDPEWALLGIAQAPCPFGDFTNLKGKQG